MLLRFDTIARSADFDERASTMQLRPWQWRFLFAADGRTRLDELARASGIEFETAADLVVETEELGLINIVTQSLDEYRDSLGAAPQLSAGPMVVTFAPAPTPAPSPFAESSFSVTPSVEEPVAKRVSVSFDSMSSMFADVAPASVAATNGVAHDHDLDHGHDVDESPFAFEIPDHMVPLAERFPEMAPPLPSEPADVPAKKSVSFSLFASTFGAPTPEFADGAASSPNGHATELSFNGHGASDDGFVEPSSNGHASYAANDVPFTEVHDAVAPVSFALEPQATSFDVAQTHESVEAVRTYGHEATPEVAPAPQDDVLFQHFTSPTSETHRPESSTPFEDDALKANGDLTGSLLRALGLKK